MGIKKNMGEIEEKKVAKDMEINAIIENIANIEELLKGSHVPELSGKASKIAEEIDRLEGRQRDIES
ncbi:MAG: hypothetical protein Q8O17_04470, partial [Candidatus Methanoperedens sp.]|nr:hypothetical protein [Candidatus Methanoperedens sp.]